MSAWPATSCWIGAAALALPVMAMPWPALAQASAVPPNPQIEIAYVEPARPDYRPIFERLKQRQVLEELQQFLAPLLLTRKVLVKIDQCGGMTSPYKPGGPVVICYEYIAKIESLAPAEKTADGVSRANAIAGAFVEAVLHEVAHALFDVLKVPVFGREDDAADKLAAFIMLQFGKDTAVRALRGSAWFFEASNRTWTGSDFSDVSGPETQRYYNYLCMALGGDRETFTPILRDTLLKTARAVWCAKEYSDLRFAFNKTIMPHVDPDLLKTVQSMEWLKADDGAGIK
jgi:hypothetical protein